MHANRHEKDGNKRKTYGTGVARRASTEATGGACANAVVETANEAWATHFDHGGNGSKGSGIDRGRGVGVSIAVIGTSAVCVVNNWESFDQYVHLYHCLRLLGDGMSGIFWRNPILAAKSPKAVSLILFPREESVLTLTTLRVANQDQLGVGALRVESVHGRGNGADALDHRGSVCITTTISLSATVKALVTVQSYSEVAEAPYQAG
jgi:hypothetical protein